MKAISLFLISLVISTGMFGTSFMTPKKAVPAFNSIEEILSTIDPNILPHGPYPGSFAEGANLNANYNEVLNQKAVEVRNYIAGKYAEDLSDFSNTDIITLAIMLVPFEQRDMFL